MKKAWRRSVVAAVMTTVMASGGLAACTPRPDTADPVAVDFLEAWDNQDYEAFTGITDQADLAATTMQTTYAGLQAEDVELTLGDVQSREAIATATYTVTWKLPRERELTYDASMTLTKMGDEWTVRWQPSLVHPQLGANQHLELRAVNAQRASVISSDGVPVLQPGTTYRILVDPAESSDAAAAVKRVATSLEQAHARDPRVPRIDAEEVVSQLGDTPYSLATVDETLGREMEQELAGVPGIVFNDEAAMVSTDPSFAPDIVSRVARIVDEELDGSNGWRVSIVTANGAVIDDVVYHAPELAPSVRISLDHDVQRAAQEAVDMRQEMQAMLVAVRPSSGEILAVAQTREADKDGNIALMGMFPPGSTFKIITAAAGIQNQGMTPGTPVPCPGTMNIFGRVVTNYNGFSLGTTSLDRAFASSCNTTFADMSTRLAPGELQDVGKQFGLGIDYQIPGLDTITGSVPEGETALDRTEAGYGQGLDLASPFGMALVAATAAAGRTPTPVLISGHETTASEQPPAPDPAAISQLQSMMASVVNGGTARGMQQTGGQVYAKTGEAEINEGSHSWLTGYREDDIAFATLVVLGGGSETATAITDRFFIRLDEMRTERQPTTTAQE